jgi:hypothetical protein
MRRDGSMAIVFADPRACAVCGQLHCFFVNRLGSTCCISCDHERQGDSANLLPAAKSASISDEDFS